MRKKHLGHLKIINKQPEIDEKQDVPAILGNVCDNLEAMMIVCKKK